MSPKKLRGATRSTDAFIDVPTRSDADNPAANMVGLSADVPRIVEIPINDVSPNPDQPRKLFDQESLDSLAQSIRDKGMTCPLLVARTQTPGKFVITGGERRWRACKLLGLPTVFAIIHTGDADEVALIDNMQRVDLNVLEMAHAFQRFLARRPGTTLADVGKMVGRSKSDVSMIMGTLRLLPEIQVEYPSHAKVVGNRSMMLIAQQPDHQLQLDAWELAKTGAPVVQIRSFLKDVEGGASAKNLESGDVAKTKPQSDLGRSLRSFISTWDKRIAFLESQRARFEHQDIDGLRSLRDRIDRLIQSA